MAAKLPPIPPKNRNRKAPSDPARPEEPGPDTRAQESRVTRDRVQKDRIEDAEAENIRQNTAKLEPARVSGGDGERDRHHGSDPRRKS